MSQLSPPKQCRIPIQYGAEQGMNRCASGDRRSRSRSLSAHESGLIHWRKKIRYSINIRYVRTGSTDLCINGGDSGLGTAIPSSHPHFSSPPPFLSRLAASRPPWRTARQSRLRRAARLSSVVCPLVPSLRTARSSARR